MRDLKRRMKRLEKELGNRENMKKMLLVEGEWLKNGYHVRYDEIDKVFKSKEEAEKYLEELEKKYKVILIELVGTKDKSE